MLQKILEKVFVTKKFTQCKISCTLKINEFKIPDNKNTKKLFSRYKLLSWIKLISALIPLKYWYYNSPYLELSYLPHHFCDVFILPTETSFQHNPHHIVHRFSYLILRHSTMRHHRCWIYQTICQSKPIEFNIKLYKCHNILWVKLATHQYLPFRC